MAQEGYYTRSKKKSSPARGLPHLIPVTHPTKGSGMGASSPEACRCFLQLIGFTESTVQIDENNVLKEELATTIADGLSHSEKLDCDLDTLPDDPYYTTTQWEMRNKRARGCLVEMIAFGEEEKVPGKEVMEQIKKWRAGCRCSAHLCDKEWAYELIEIPEPLTDDWGVKLASVLLPIIFRESNLFEYKVEGVRAGSAYVMNYILQLPSGAQAQFTGWPDFTVSQRLMPLTERRVLELYSRRARLQAVGETQSKQGNSEESKTATISQAALYGIGQLAKNPPTKKMVIIMLFKDKSAQVGVTTLSTDNVAEVESSIGQVSFKFVDRLDSMSLKDPMELQQFCKILVGALKWKLAPDSP